MPFCACSSITEAQPTCGDTADEHPVRLRAGDLCFFMAFVLRRVQFYPVCKRAHTLVKPPATYKTYQSDPQRSLLLYISWSHQKLFVVLTIRPIRNRFLYGGVRTGRYAPLSQADCAACSPSSRNNRARRARGEDIGAPALAICFSMVRCSTAISHY